MKTVRAVKHSNKLEAEYYRNILSISKNIYKIFKETIDIKEFSDSKDKQINKFDKLVDKELRKSDIISLNMSDKLYNYFNRSLARNFKNKAIGIDLTKFYRGDFITKDFLADSSGEYIEKYGKDVSIWLKTSIRENYINGGSSKNLIESIEERFEVDKRKAKLIARNETGTFIGSFNVKRANDLGIEEGIWRAIKDERTRTSHRQADGKVFPIDKGLEVDGQMTFPSLPINCRCWMEFVIK